MRSALNRLVSVFSMSRLRAGTGSRFRRRLGAANRSVAAEFLEYRLLPAQITVTSLADNTVQDGEVTLREAIDAANRDASVDGSEAGSGADEIVFSAALRGQGSLHLLVSNGELSITSSLTIRGFGSSASVLDAQSNSRLFRISDGAGAVRLISLGLTGGATYLDNADEFSIENNGGAILHSAAGTLELIDCSLSGNETYGAWSAGGAIYTVSGCTLQNCIMQSNRTQGTNAVGGAISTRNGVLSIADTLFVGNQTIDVGACGGAAFVGTQSAHFVRCTFTSNTTAAVDSAGGAVAAGSASIEFEDCDFQYNSTSGTGAFGGAVAVDSGVLSLVRSSLFGNNTYGNLSFGGAVGGANAAVVRLVNSTLSENSTQGDDAEGGGVAMSVGVLRIIQSTLSGNQTLGLNSGGGAIAVLSGELRVVQSTIAKNLVGQTVTATGGGVFCTAETLQIDNTIVAGNADSGLASDLFLELAPGAVAGSVRHSLIGRSNGSGLTTTTGLSADNFGNFVGGGTAATALDAKLNPLRSNGGRTLTLAPRSDSLAINGGSVLLAQNESGAALLTDQRSEAPMLRNRGGFVDIGAIERFTYPGPIIVSTVQHELDDNISAGDLSLAEAISLANGSEGTDTILFAAQIDGTPIQLSPVVSGLDFNIVIRESVIITGNGSSRTILDGGLQRRVLDITEDVADVLLEKMHLRNGNPGLSGMDNADHRGAGGAIRMIGPGSLNLNLMTLSGNRTDRDNAPGGAMAFFGGMLTIVDSSFEGNETAGRDSDGGGMVSYGDRTTISRSTFSGNRTRGASADGGAISGPMGGLVFSQSTISGNSVLGTDATGGGIHSELLPGVQQPATGILLSQSTVVQNRSEFAAGGGIASVVTIDLRNSILAKNSAGGFQFNSVFVTGTDLWPIFEAPVVLAASLLGRSDGTLLVPTSGGADANGNLIGGITAAAAIDPQLGELGNNGGPTKTHVPLSGSPAIDSGRTSLAVDVTAAGTPPNLLFDQRGNPNTRVLDGDHRKVAVLPVVDMGAAEFPGLRLLSPAPNATTLRPTLRWTAIAGAASYRIHINNNTTGKTPYLVTTASTNQFTPTTDFEIGRYTLWVMPVYATGESVWSAPQTFNVIAGPVWQAMQRTQLTARPTLLWNLLPGAVKYEIWGNNHSTGQQQTFRQFLTGTSWTLPVDLPMGIHRFWLRGIDVKGGATVWSVLQEFLVVPMVTPLTPGSSLFDTTPEFSWGSVTGAAAYDLLVRNTANNSVVIDQKNITATRFTPTTALPVGTYKWYVFAVSPASIGSIRSGGAITRDVYIGGRPTLIAPSGSGQPGRPEFRWSLVDDAASYSVWVSRFVAGQLQKQFEVGGLTGLSWQPETALTAGSYRTWVKAVSGTGTDSLWSIPLDFSIS